MNGKFKEAAGRFFYETFRPRNKEDYSAIFARGYNNNGKKPVYPWFYSRVFAVLNVIFAIYSIICCTVSSSFYYRTMYLVGASIIDVAFLVLLFELYPQDDFSLFAIVSVCIIGGTASTFISSLVYEITGNPSGWLLAVTAGVGEEISKAIPAVICILALKKKDNPLAGFLIGAAVGTWFSITENMVYIANSYKDYVKILTALGRALSAPFSHAAWSAIIGWAFCKFRKPLLNLKFYGVTVLCMSMHFLCDMPLLDEYPLVFVLIFACAAEAAVTLSFEIYIIVSERKATFSGKQENIFVGQRNGYLRERRTNAFITCGGVLFCLLALITSSLFGYSYTQSYIKDERFTSVEQFVLFAQNGLSLYPDRNRKFDENARNSEEEFNDNDVLIYAEQIEETDGHSFVYCYNFNVNVYPDGSTAHTFTLCSIYLLSDVEGQEEQLRTPLINHYYFDDENSVQYRISYFLLNDEAYGISLGFEDGQFVFYNRAENIKTLNLQSILLICLTGAEALATAVGWIILKNRNSGSPENDGSFDDYIIKIN